jgi:hypothetical protein
MFLLLRLLLLHSPLRKAWQPCLHRRQGISSSRLRLRDSCSTTFCYNASNCLLLQHPSR